LFDNKERLQEVKYLSETHRFFHSQLEFVEVFKERGGFDVIVGNPPWVNITMDEGGILSEKNPEIFIRKLSAPAVKKMADQILNQDRDLKTVYLDENIWADSTKLFISSIQNYILLQGQRNNLYKCILSNSFSLISQTGFIGLVHPEGTYDDPNGQLLRSELYPRLKYHFQFINELMLFQEIHHSNFFGIHIYSGFKNKIDFISISNLFSVSTIDGCFLHDGFGEVGGIKIKDLSTNKLKWNIFSHKNRIVKISEAELTIIANTFENGINSNEVKLVSIHSKEILDVLKRFSLFKTIVSDYNYFSTNGLNETNSPRDGIIIRETKYPNYDN
jgi:hypothetical protein